VANHLLDTPALIITETTVEDVKDAVVTTVSSDNNPAVSDNHPSDPNLLPQGQITSIASSGLLSLLNSYSAPLSRFAATAAWKSAKASPASSTSASPPITKPSSRRPSNSFLKLPGTLNSDPDTPSGPITPPDILVTPMVSLPMVIAIALIAFLIGSLLRSLLSPADFIYVVTDLQDVEHTTGWREIKRLLEVKYILRGWDFQIAMVRRH